MARVEPYGPGAWKFFCDCGGEAQNTTRPIGCTRIVTDSEPNFSCETPITEAGQQKCKFRWKLAPLIEAWMKQDAEERAKAFLATLEEKRKEALETLGLTEGQVNAAKAPPITR